MHGAKANEQKWHELTSQKSKPSPCRGAMIAFGLCFLCLCLVATCVNNVDLHQLPISPLDLDVGRLENISFQMSNSRAREESIIRFFDRNFLNLPWEAIEHVIGFAKSDVLKLFWTPEKCDSDFWVYLGQQLNVVNLFIQSKYWMRMEILININKWLIRRDQLFPIRNFPNKRHVLSVVGGWLKEMLNYLEANANPNTEFFFKIIRDSLFNSNDDYIIPKKSFILYCHYHLENFEELHGGSIEDSAELLLNGPFSKHFPNDSGLQDWAATGRYYKYLRNFLSRHSLTISN